MRWARPVPASQEILEKIEEKHGIGFHEIEDLFQRRHVVLRGAADRYGEVRYTSLGETGAGRYLLVVYTKPEPMVAKVITARIMTDREKRHYKGVRRPR